MAMEADREAKFEMVLSRHVGLAVERGEAEVPVLIFRHPMRRDTRRLGVVLEKLRGLDEQSDEGAANAVLDELEGVVKSMLVGWRGQVVPGSGGVEELVAEADQFGAAGGDLRSTGRRGEELGFDLGDFDLVVDESDLGELAARLRVEPGLTLAEKKTSALRSASSTGFSAGGAEAGGATGTQESGSGGRSWSSAPGAGGAEGGGGAGGAEGGGG